VNENHYERYVKVSNGGRVINASNALRSIRARDEKDEEDELMKARNELEGAERKHKCLVEEEEKKKKRKEEKA
jgi:cellobiose-specific phosphotransferase system component IIA